MGAVRERADEIHAKTQRTNHHKRAKRARAGTSAPAFAYARTGARSGTGVGDRAEDASATF